MRCRSFAVSPLLSLAVACSSSSSGPCVAEGTVTVTVTDEDVDSDSNFLCDATVTIAPASGGSPQTLTFQGYDGSDADCQYVINEPPGRYVLRATAPGHTALSETLDLEVVDCVTASPMTRLGLFEIPGYEPGGDAGADASDASPAG